MHKKKEQQSSALHFSKWLLASQKVLFSDITGFRNWLYARVQSGMFPSS
jgi:hypothetical protein